MLSNLRDIEKYNEGRAECREELILNMLKYHSPDDIFKFTKIPLEDIITIQKEHYIELN